MFIFDIPLLDLTNPASQTANSAQSVASAQQIQAKKAKIKKPKDQLIGGVGIPGGTLAPNGQQIVDPASSSAPVKIKNKREGEYVNMRRPGAGNNTIEYRLDYVCNFLGIKKENAKEQKVLDFCLDDICRMDFIIHFANLKELVLINQGIQQIEGIDRLKYLEKCWLNQNYFDSIKCFDKLRNIKEIYLGYNRITSTNGLQNCIMLEKLWIDCNQIDTITGLSNLERLEHLNLAGNNVEQIGIGLDGLVSLSVLNLSANKIGNFKEVLNLNRLPCLSICTFNDPHYGDNPICNLCNYSTYVLYHLPRLYRLDTEMISDDSKNFAEGTFMKKRMYYNMRIKTIQRNTSNIMKLIKICKKVRNFKIDIQVSKLTRKLNEIQRELEERQHLDQNNIDEFDSIITYGPDKQKKNPLNAIDNDKLIDDIQSKMALINGRLHDKNEDLKDLHIISESLRSKVYDMSEQNIHRLMTELETGGNIRFEEGKPTDKWFSSCVDLVRSRFSPEQMKFFGIIGINVTRVTRIHNRFLRNRFEEKLEQLVDLSDNSYKRNLEYLFYGVDPALPTEIYRSIEEGFRSQSEYSDIDLPNCIPLVNSVSSAEIARINSFFQAEDGYAQMRSAAKAQKQSQLRENQELTIQKGLVQIPSGQLLVCKVFLSKCISDLNFPHFNPSHSPSEIWKYAPVDTKNYNHVSSIFRTKENDQKQRLWFVFDNALVLPEYLVEFDYIINKSLVAESKRLQDITQLNAECNKLFKGITETQRVIENTYIRYAQKENPRLQNVHLTTNDLDRSDMGCLKKNLHQLMCQFHIKELMENQYEFAEDDLNSTQAAIENSMPPDIPMRSQIDEISESIIQNISRENNLSNIIYLNLFNNKIKKIQGLQNLINLKTLILSFNEIEEIENLENCTNLSKLDLHNNFIRIIKNLEGKDKITYLDLTHNWINDWSQIEHLKVNLPNLKELGMRCNPISTKRNYRPLIFTKLPYIVKLDNQSFNDKDKERVNQEMKILSIQLIIDCVKDQRKGLFEKDKADSDEEGGAGQIYEEQPDSISASGNNILPKESTAARKQDWEKQIEILNVSHKSISIIKNLDQFINLRKLNLMDNNIAKIQGLEQCKLLEELSLEKNQIKIIENIGHLKYLKKLDLGQNRILKIQNINQLESLTQLSLEDNQISKLSGFEDLQTLMELYLGNNLIDEIKEIINLKELQRLIILDISGNNLIKEDNYRIYCIFHLRRLRVLDGLSIENSECVEAKETFAGRLTQEILESRLGGSTLANIKELDLSGCKLRDFDKMFDRDFCPNLRELNISHNFFASLRGFGYLPQLRILKIKQNRLESLFCKLNEDGYPRGLFGLHSLEVLDVSFNSLHDLYGIQLAPMKDLKILHASNNEITKVDFLEKLKQLRELDLSKNRIRQIDPNSFHNQMMISCLKLEDNGMRSLANIERLERLQAFHGGGNRLAEFWEVDRLAELVYLMEISLMNNPMTRKPQYRLGIIKKLPNLIVLDGKEITIDERNRIETSQVYDAQKAPPMIHYSQYPTAKVPVKLNSVNFDGVFNNLKYNLQDQGATPQNLNIQGVGKNGVQTNFTGGVQGLSIGGQNQQGINVGQAEIQNLIQGQNINQQLQLGNVQNVGVSAGVNLVNQNPNNNQNDIQLQNQMQFSKLRQQQVQQRQGPVLNNNSRQSSQQMKFSNGANQQTLTNLPQGSGQLTQMGQIGQQMMQINTQSIQNQASQLTNNLQANNIQKQHHLRGNSQKSQFIIDQSSLQGNNNNNIINNISNLSQKNNENSIFIGVANGINGQRPAQLIKGNKNDGGKIFEQKNS